MIEVQDMMLLPGLAVPQDFYWVLKVPAPLAGMRVPFSNTPWEQLASLGFKHVVRLAKVAVPQDPSPLTIIHDVALTDLVYGESPKDPLEEMKMIRAATQAVVTSIKAGKGVVVHCVGGTGRTGTVIGCALREFGYPAADAISYLDRLNKARGKYGWPESEWQAQAVREYC